MGASICLESLYNGLVIIAGIAEAAISPRNMSQITSPRKLKA